MPVRTTLVIPFGREIRDFIFPSTPTLDNLSRSGVSSNGSNRFTNNRCPS